MEVVAPSRYIERKKTKTLIHKYGKHTQPNSSRPTDMALMQVKACIFPVHYILIQKSRKETVLNGPLSGVILKIN